MANEGVQEGSQGRELVEGGWRRGEGKGRGWVRMGGGSRREEIGG